MKRLFTILTVVVLTTTMSLAQDLTSKKGENYLPEGDEWSIGFNADPLLKYFGNFIGQANGGNIAPTVGNYFNDNAFYGKKMIDDNSAWRARVEFGFSSLSVTVPHKEDLGTTTVNWQDKPDKFSVSSFNTILWLGKEMRRGSTRLQGVYGAEVGVGFGSGVDTSASYGHNVWDDGGNGGPNHPNGFDGHTFAGATGTARVTEIDNGGSFSVNARVFIGAEYFVLPKMSLSAEYGWGISLNSSGAGTTTTETADVNSSNQNFSTKEDAPTDKSSGFGIGNDLRGSLGLHLYF